MEEEQEHRRRYQINPLARAISEGISAQIRSNLRVRVITVGLSLVLGILLVIGLVFLVRNIQPLQIIGH